jgi:ParB-like chromosome segregation protein Spo0J
MVRGARSRQSPRSNKKKESRRQHLERVKIANVIVGAGQRSLDRDSVGAISESLREIGLKTPITVRRLTSGKTVLVSGLHRLEAAKLLGWKEIDAIYMNGDEREARLWQISENLHRADLTVLQRNEQIAEWLRLIQDKPEVSGHVVQKPQGGRPEGGLSLAVRSLPVAGKSQEARRKSVERGVRVDSTTINRHCSPLLSNRLRRHRSRKSMNLRAENPDRTQVELGPPTRAGIQPFWSSRSHTRRRIRVKTKTACLG